MNHSSPPDLSIIAELENIKSGDRSLPFDMLDQVLAQVDDLHVAAEVIVLYDDREFEEDFIQDLLEKRERSHLNVELQGVPIQTSSYVALKNEGVRRAAGRLLVFIDGDVVPQPGWLKNLLAPFEDPSVDIVAGHTNVGPMKSFHHRAFALFWIFEYQPSSDDIVDSDVFVANNFAARAHVLKENPFPQSEQYRAQAAQHARFLIGRGFRLVYQPNARIFHAPPRDFWMRRAVWHGHDMSFVYLKANDPRRLLILSPLVIVAGFFKNSVRRIFSDRRAVGMPWWEVPAALAMAAIYDACKLVGFVGARLAPKMLARAIPPP